MSCSPLKRIWHGQRLGGLAVVALFFRKFSFCSCWSLNYSPMPGGTRFPLQQLSHPWRRTYWGPGLRPRSIFPAYSAMNSSGAPIAAKFERRSRTHPGQILCPEGTTPTLGAQFPHGFSRPAFLLAVHG